MVHTATGDLEVETVGELDSDDHGRFLSRKGRVEISELLAPAVEQQTLLHELGHKMLFDAGIKLSEKTEEAVCDAYALFTGYLIRYNPQVVKYLAS